MLVGNRGGVGLTRSTASSLMIVSRMIVGPRGTDQATSMASPWMVYPNDQNFLRLNHQLSRQPRQVELYRNNNSCC